MEGLFISIEGMDGSGKSTQIKLLVDYFEKNGHNVVLTREPGSTKLGEKIRDLVLDKEHMEMHHITEVLLYAASRAQLVNEVIKPSLDQGFVVICDRFLDSSLVYQGIGRGISIDDVLKINSYGVNNIFPTITFYLDISPSLSLERKKKVASLDRIELQDDSFHHQVYEGYKLIAEMFKDRVQVIDASKTIEEIHSNIINIINSKTM